MQIYVLCNNSYLCRYEYSSFTLMNNTFYQPTYEKGLFDYSDEIYKGEALDNQREALGQRRAAANKTKIGEAPELVKGWDVHAAPMQQSYAIKLNKRGEAAANGDMNAVAKYDRELLQLKNLLRADAEYGSKIDAMTAKIDEGGAGLTLDSKKKVSDFVEMQRKALTVDPNTGDLIFNGKPLGYDNTPFTKYPQLEEVRDSWFKKSFDSLKGETWSQARGGNGGLIARNEQLNAAIDGMAQEGLDNGFLKSEDVESYKNRLFESLSMEDTWKAAPKDNSGNDGVPTPSVAVVPIMGADIKDIRAGQKVTDNGEFIDNSEGMSMEYGIDMKTTPVQTSDRNGKKGVVIGSYKGKDDGKLYLNIVYPTQDIAAALFSNNAEERKEAFRLAMAKGSPREIVKYNSASHGGAIADIGTKLGYKGKFNESKLIKEIDNYNKREVDESESGYTDAELSRFVGGGTSLEQLKGMSEEEIKQIEADFDKQLPEEQIKKAKFD